MNSFTTHKISAHETLAGYVLNLSQQRVMQNELAEIAEQILSLNFNPLNPVDFAQQHAFLKGQLQYLQTVLDRSKPSEQELLRLAQESQS